MGWQPSNPVGWVEASRPTDTTPDGVLQSVGWVERQRDPPTAPRWQDPPRGGAGGSGRLDPPYEATRLQALSISSWRMPLGGQSALRQLASAVLAPACCSASLSSHSMFTAP